MRRDEIILHVSLHVSYHRGDVGVFLHKNGDAPCKRPAEPRYAFRLQVIHEGSVRFPLGLRFERLSPL